MGWIVLVRAAVLVWIVFACNRLFRFRNQVRNEWADIDVQFTRRHDLVPQLVTAVQAHANHERTVLEAVTQLRSQAVQQTAAQTRLLDGLFQGSAVEIVLKNSDARTIASARAAHQDALDKQLAPEYFNKNFGSVGKAIVIAVIGGASGYSLLKAVAYCW